MSGKSFEAKRREGARKTRPLFLISVASVGLLLYYIIRFDFSVLLASPPSRQVQSHQYKSTSFIPTSLLGQVAEVLESGSGSGSEETVRSGVNIDKIIALETSNFAHGPINGVALQGVLLALKKACCWFYFKRKNSYEEKGFTMDTRKYKNVTWLNRQHLQNLAWVKKQDAFVCLNRYECWNERMYEQREKFFDKSKTNRILYAKDVWSTKAAFCKALHTALAKTGDDEDNKAVEYWINEFSFSCFILPENYSNLQLRANEMPQSKWIIKPQAAQAGKGIFVRDREGIQSLSKKNKYVVQPYLQNPLLVDGRKFDMRIHIIVTSVLPLRAYLHPKAFVRFAATKHSDAKDGGQKSSFLTNISVNNKIIPTDQLTWQFHQFLEYLGDSADIVFSRIVRAIGLMLLTTEKVFERKYNARMGTGFKCKNCYQTLGVDVILDEFKKPYIIEVNGNPTMDFTAEKLNADAFTLHKHMTEMLYNFDDVSHSLYEDIEAVATSGRIDHSLDFLDDDMIEYLIMSKKEQQNLKPWYKLYPPTLLNNEEVETWNALMEQLDLSEPRRKLHNLMVELNNERVKKCISSDVECSLDVLYACRLNPDSSFCENDL